MIRRGCYGQAPSMKAAAVYLGQLGRCPADRSGREAWLLKVMVAKDAPTAQRNAAAIEKRYLGLYDRVAL